MGVFFFFCKRFSRRSCPAWVVGGWWFISFSTTVGLAHLSCMPRSMSDLGRESQIEFSNQGEFMLFLLLLTRTGVGLVWRRAAAVLLRAVGPERHDPGTAFGAYKHYYHLSFQRDYVNWPFSPWVSRSRFFPSFIFSLLLTLLSYLQLSTDRLALLPLVLLTYPGIYIHFSSEYVCVQWHFSCLSCKRLESRKNA